MKTKLIVVGFFSLLLLSACTIIEVKQDYDPTYNFSKLKTYDWKLDINKKKHQLIVKQLRHELKDQLAGKGFVHNASNPDFLIALHGGTEDKVIIDNQSYGYGYGRWNTGSRLSVYEYKEGTLVIDFIESKSQDLIFRSTVITEVSRDISAENQRKKIKEVIKKAIESFPPGAKKN